MKDINPLVVDLQARMFANRLPLGRILNHADLNRSTWSRWTKGAEPKFSSIKKVEAAIEKMLEERAA